MIVECERELLSWYVDELYARADAYRQWFPDITFLDARREDLNDIGSVRSMLDSLGFKMKPSICSMLGMPTNLKGCAT